MAIYRYEVTSIEGLIQQLVVHLRNGYWFHVSGVVPERRSAREVDEKLMAKYDVMLSKYQKARRRARGVYNTHYLRFGSRWFLLATHGTHPQDRPMSPAPNNFHVAERKTLRDARYSPIRVDGYSVSSRRGGDGKRHVLVRIDEPAFKGLRDYLVERAARRSLGWCINQIWNFPFQPYEPVRKQYRSIVRKMNAARKTAGYKPIPEKFIPYQRKIVKPFELVSGANGEMGEVAQPQPDYRSGVSRTSIKNLQASRADPEA